MAELQAKCRAKKRREAGLLPSPIRRNGARPLPARSACSLQKVVPRRRPRRRAAGPKRWRWRPPRATAGRRCAWCCIAVSAAADSSSTPTTTAARPPICSRTRAPRSCFTGRRSSGKCASKDAWKNCRAPNRIDIFRAVRARAGSARGHRRRARRSPADRSSKEEFARVDARFGDRKIPCPPFWGGFRIVASCIEFWQGQPHRLHDRVLYRKKGNIWTNFRLGP